MSSHSNNLILFFFWGGGAKCIFCPLNHYFGGSCPRCPPLLTSMHWKSHIRFPISLLLQLCLYLCRLRDIVSYFPKFEDVTWPWTPPSIIHALVGRLLNISQHTKFEIPCFAYSNDIIGAHFKKKWLGVIVLSMG